MKETTDLPEIKDELERKTVAEIDNLIGRRESGKITNSEYLASINSIFAICSGLVTRELIDIISEASEETVNDFSFLRTRVFEKDDRISVISRKRSDGGFNAKIITATVGATKVFTGILDETDTNLETEQKIANFMSNLWKVGYKELLDEV